MVETIMLYIKRETLLTLDLNRVLDASVLNNKYRSLESNSIYGNLFLILHNMLCLAIINAGGVLYKESTLHKLLRLPILLISLPYVSVKIINTYSDLQVSFLPIVVYQLYGIANEK